MHYTVRAFLVVASLLAGGCGVRNLGETCVPTADSLDGPDKTDGEGASSPGPIGDVFCAPGRCHPDLGVCVECVEDIDCYRKDVFDEPRCEKGIPKSEGGDGQPFCTYTPRTL